MSITILLLIIVFLQSVIELIIVFFIMIRLGDIVARIDKTDKDMNELWKAHRMFRGFLRGMHNRFVQKISEKFRELGLNTDFSSERYKDDD